MNTYIITLFHKNKQTTMLLEGITADNNSAAITVAMGMIRNPDSWTLVAIDRMDV